MRVRLSRRAEIDLAEITDFIALDNPERAFEFEDELIARAHKFAEAPRPMWSGSSGFAPAHMALT